MTVFSIFRRVACFLTQGRRLFAWEYRLFEAIPITSVGMAEYALCISLSILEVFKVFTEYVVRASVYLLNRRFRHSL
jgi:hypothetical protein